MENILHHPVLLAEVLAGLEPGRGGVFVDATVGLGGHARALLEAEPELRVVGFDVDAQALEHAKAVLDPFRHRVVLVHASYGDLDHQLDLLGLGEVDGILFDFGVSSLQLDSAHRGFSFRLDGPLDMRFSGEGMTAAELLATATEVELVTILRDFGEEPRARRIARALIQAQTREPLSTTGQLKRLVTRAVGGHRGATDPSTRTFQALRIAVNRELAIIAPAVEHASRRLAQNGRIAAIAFHSLEDRLVKRTLRRLSGRCICPPGTHGCECAPESLLELITRRPIRPGEAETRRNPRARSARLRLALRRTT